MRGHNNDTFDVRTVRRLVREKRFQLDFGSDGSCFIDRHRVVVLRDIFTIFFARRRSRKLLLKINDTFKHGLVLIWVQSTQYFNSHTTVLFDKLVVFVTLFGR